MMHGYVLLHPFYYVSKYMRLSYLLHWQAGMLGSDLFKYLCCTYTNSIVIDKDSDQTVKISIK